MVVIADTSPLNYLILIEADGVLPQLYGQVLVPSAVIRELLHADALDRVLHWVADPPEWLRVEHVRQAPDPVLDNLGAGEREAIILAEAQTGETLILMDEIMGREQATSRGLVSTGTLGVLDAAAEVGLLDLPSAIARLRDTSFHVTPSLLKRLLDRDTERRRTANSPQDAQ